MVKQVNLVPEKKRETLSFVLEDVFTPQECADFIKRSEETGYEPALLNIGGGRQTYAPNIRNNDRCIIDDEGVAEKLYQRIKEYIPQSYKGYDAMGLNERYDPGNSFKAHQDGTYVREYGPKRVQIYLNEGFEGGETTFFDDDGTPLAVVPKIGSVLVFQHDMLHEGSKLVKGRKYCIRTDVMYKRANYGKRRENIDEEDLR